MLLFLYESMIVTCAKFVSTGNFNATKFQHTWTLVFTQLLIKILFFMTLISSLRMRYLPALSCAERYYITGTVISSNGLNLLHLIFVPLSVSALAALIDAYLGVELTYSGLSYIMRFLAFGPFVWLYIIVFVIYVYTSDELLPTMTKSSAETNEMLSVFGNSTREIVSNLLNMIFGSVILFMSNVWIFDVVKKSYNSMSVKLIYLARYAAISNFVYGLLIIISSLQVVFTSAKLFFIFNAVTLRIVEVNLIISSMLFLLNKMNVEPESHKSKYLRHRISSGAVGTMMEMNERDAGRGHRRMKARTLDVPRTFSSNNLGESLHRKVSRQQETEMPLFLLNHDSKCIAHADKEHLHLQPGTSHHQKGFWSTCSTKKRNHSDGDMKLNLKDLHLDRRPQQHESPIDICQSVTSTDTFPVLNPLVHLG